MRKDILRIYECSLWRFIQKTREGPIFVAHHEDQELSIITKLGTNISLKIMHLKVSY